MALVTTARQARPRAEPLGKGRQEQEQSHRGLVVWVFLLEFQLCSPRCGHTCVPPTQRLTPGCSAQRRVLRLLANPCTLGELSPTAGRGGEVSAQKKHRFSFASAGGRRAAPVASPAEAQLPHRWHVLRGDGGFLSATTHLQSGLPGD